MSASIIVLSNQNCWGSQNEAPALPDRATFAFLIDYRPDTGEFIWKERSVSSSPWRPSVTKVWNKRFAGKACGCIIPSGYVRISLFGRNYRAHRIAWLLVYGEWPSGEIDHINHVRSDNRIANLRSVDDVGNSRNQKLHSRNKSGVSGVSFDESRQKWSVMIGANGRRVRVGRFQTIEEAIEARKSAEKRLGFHENHGRPL